MYLAQKNIKTMLISPARGQKATKKKMPEHSCTSHIGHFLVLSHQYSLCHVMSHDVMTSYHEITCRHIIGSQTHRHTHGSDSMTSTADAKGNNQELLCGGWLIIRSLLRLLLSCTLSFLFLFSCRKFFRPSGVSFQSMSSVTCRLVIHLQIQA